MKNLTLKPGDMVRALHDNEDFGVKRGERFVLEQGRAKSLFFLAKSGLRVELVDFTGNVTDATDDYAKVKGIVLPRGTT